MYVVLCSLVLLFITHLFGCFKNQRRLYGRQRLHTFSTLTLFCGLILGIFEMPPVDMIPIKDCLPVTLIFDQIRDPGNFGTLLRTAAAVGCEKVIAVKGKVELE